MTRYFTFTEDISNKFWQIETNNSTFTVTFGRIGTMGQSQYKTFDSVERCEQEADKLIREKTRKGYVESVNGVTVPSTSQSATRSAKTDDQQAQEAVLNRYDELIRNTLTDQLLPFLKSVDKQYYTALGKRIKDAKRYWCEYVELKSNEWNTENKNAHWGYRGTTEQRTIVNLSALGLLSFQEAKAFDLYWLMAGHEWNNHTLPILQWARPKWLTEFLTTMAQKESWRILPYQQLRTLEEQKLVVYDPELFAMSIARLAMYDHHTNQRNDSVAHIGFLSTDSTVVSREIPTLFDYPALVNDTVYSLQESDGTYKPVYIWPQVFNRLLAEGKLDRLWFFEKCLSVQTKDWNINLRAFWRKQFEASNPTPAELLALQSILFPLLAAQHPHVVSWTVGLLKTMYSEPDFRVSELLDWATSVMMRDDCKTALKTLLSMLERLLKTQPDQRTAIASLLVDIFVINDLSLQTKAASLLVKYADPSDTDLKNRLGAYKGQMLGNVVNDLEIFLTNEDTTTFEEASEPVTYQYVRPKPVRGLMPDQEVKLPTTWNDFLFLIGQFIASDDPLDIEILMNALILPPADMPADFREQLKVYEKKLEKTYFNTYVKEAFRYYIMHWISGNDDETQLNYSLNLLVTSSGLCLPTIQRKRISQLQRKRKSNSTLPLLSLPTHAPYWIAPTTLVKRLLAYQQADEPIDPLDLAIAIARMPREDTDEAITLYTGLGVKMAQLMGYCLGATHEILLSRSEILSQLKAVFGGENVVADQNALWAVATRTFGPDGVYPEFTDMPFSNVPNVVKPYLPAYTINENWNEWKNYRTHKMERSPSWRELQLTLPTDNKSFPTLLYSNDLYHLKEYSQRWHYENMGSVDLRFWHSLIPQQPEALFTMIASYGSRTADGSASAACALKLMFEPNFQFREMSMLVLACGLLTKKRETGAMAAEILIHHVAEQTLDADALGNRLGWLLANDYAPVQRLIDVLNLVKDVSPLHNKALLQMLDALFIPFSALGATPKNTVKLLEIYLDLLVKSGGSPSQATAATLTSWQTTPSLKKLCTEILKKA